MLNSDSAQIEIDDTLNEEEAIHLIEDCYIRNGGRNLTQPMRNYLRQETIRAELSSSLLIDVCAREITVQAAVSELMEIFGSNSLRTKSSSDVDAVHNRSAINSQLIAWNVKGREEIKLFRKEVLNGKLIPEQQLFDWIKRTGKKDGKPAPTRVGNKVFRYELYFTIPDTAKDKSVYVVSGGILDRLRELSIVVSTAFDWTETQASTFIVTGVFPIIEAIEVGAKVFPLEPIANKITLNIDPTSTPDEVTEAFNWARDTYFTTRSKRHTTKKDLLALHFKKTEGLTRSEKIRLWNKDCDDLNLKIKKYGQTKIDQDNFSRDLKEAYKDYLEGREPKEGLI